MNKADLLKSVVLRTGCKDTLARKMLDGLLQVMSEELGNGNNIILQGFGTFRPWEQSSRLGRNPRTGNTCLIAPRTSVKFKAGKNLLKAMNKEK